MIGVSWIEHLTFYFGTIRTTSKIRKREVILTAYPHLNVLRWLLSFEINVDAHLFFLSHLVGPVITRQVEDIACSFKAKWFVLNLVFPALSDPNYLEALPKT